MGLAVAVPAVASARPVAVPSSLAVALVVVAVPSAPVVARLVLAVAPALAVHPALVRLVAVLAVVRTVPVAVTVDIDSSLARCIVPLPPQRHTAASGHF